MRSKVDIVNKIDAIQTGDIARENILPDTNLRQARQRLDELRCSWAQVEDIGAVRARAERCLLTHPLRAADAGQLATALLVCERLGQEIPFVTFDTRLADAARREGLCVID